MDAHTQHDARRTGFLAELRRRRVLQIGAAYLVGAWLAVEVLGFLLEQAGASDQALRWVAIAFIAGFPVSVILAWVIQVQSDGSWSIDRSETRTGALLGTAALAAVLTGGLAWMLLPSVDTTAVDTAYQPIPNSIAILPFAWSDATPGERRLAGTLSNALLKGMDGARGLSLIRLNLDRRPDDAVAFGRSIKAAALLTGKVIRDSDDTRIRLELLDVVAGTARWTATVAWDATRIMEIGTDAANGVLDSLGQSTVSQKQFTGTDDREAYDHYLAGVAAGSEGSTLGWAEAIGHFERALEADPDFVRAVTELAINLHMANSVKANDEDWEQFQARTRALAEQAVEMDPESPDALSLLGRHTVNRELRHQLWDRALQAAPDHALTYFRYGVDMRRPCTFSTTGRALSVERLDNCEEVVPDLHEAERLFRLAVRYEPMEVFYLTALGAMLTEWGWQENDHARNGEGLAILEQCVELAPENRQVLGALGYQLSLAFHVDRALYYQQAAFAQDPVWWLAGWVALQFARLGMPEEAHAWTAHYVDLAQSTIQRVSNWTIGVYYHLGERDALTKARERLLEESPENKQVRLDWLKDQGDFAAAMALFDEMHPELAELAVPQVDESTPIFPLMGKADLLGQMGREDDARRLARPIYDFIDQECGEAFRAGGRFDTASAGYFPAWLPLLAGLQLRDDYLRELEHFAEGRRSRDPDLPSLRAPQPGRWDILGWIRDDPEFERLVARIEERVALQRENARRMIAAGEILAAPRLDD